MGALIGAGALKGVNTVIKAQYGVRSFTRMDLLNGPEWTAFNTGMDYQTGLLYVTLRAFIAFYMHKMAYKSHRE